MAFRTYAPTREMHTPKLKEGHGKGLGKRRPIPGTTQHTVARMPCVDPTCKGDKCHV